MSTYKLHYFDLRGRAEVARFIFAAADQEYEDIRYEHEQWSTLKAQMPLGQMPVLEIDGIKLPQSVAIARFLAKQFHLAGKDNLEQAQVDAVADTISDLIAAFVPIRREREETKIQELIKRFQTDELPKHLKNIEVSGKLYSNGEPFFVGNTLTWADLFFYDVAETMLELDRTCLDNYLWLKQNPLEVRTHPRIAEYLRNRPETIF